MLAYLGRSLDNIAISIAKQVKSGLDEFLLGLRFVQERQYRLC